MTLQQRLAMPRKLAEVVSAGMAIVGVVGLFQPSSLAKTLSLGSLIGAASTFVVNRYTHKAYVSIASQYAIALEDRHNQELEGAKRRVQAGDEEISLLELKLETADAAQQEAMQQLKSEQKAALRAEKELREAIAALNRTVEGLQVESEKHHAWSLKAKVYIESIFAAQKKFLEGFKATVLESLEDFSGRVLEQTEDTKKKYPALADRMDKIRVEAEGKQEYFEAELAKVATDLKSVPLSKAGDEFISLLYAMYNHFSLLRIQIIRAVETYKKLSLLEEKEDLESQLEAYASQDVVPREKLETLVGNYEARLKEFTDQVQNHTDSTLEFANQLEQEILGQDPVIEKAKSLLNQQAQQIANLERQLQETKKIRLFEDVSDWTALANKVILHLVRHEITCDALPLPIEEKGNEIVFYLTPRTEIGMKLVEGDAEKAMEALKIPLGVKYVKVSRSGRNLEIRIPIRERKVEKEAPEAVLERSKDLWSLYTASEYHLCLFAATQSGKTTLLDELNAMMHSRLKGEIEFHPITLKIDGNRDSEEKTGRFVKPKFMRNHEEYLEALAEVHEAIENRNLLLQVNSDKRFNREVFQWDEYGEFYRLSSEEQKKAGKKAVISLFQTGAGLSSEIGKGLSAVIVAQNPYVSSLGLQRPDLANALIVIVGEKNIRLFLDSDKSNHGLDSEDKSRLESELKIFKDKSRIASEKAMKEALEKGQDAALAVRKCPENYYSLLLPSKAGLLPVILYNLSPGEYTNQLTGTKQEVLKITCPDCVSTEVKKRGRTGNRYDCLNQDCKRQTFTWKGL